VRLLSLFALTVVVFACTNEEDHPPYLGDSDSSPPPSPGGGNGGNPIGDASVGDAGAALASASNPEGIFVAGASLYYTNYATGAGDGSVSVVSTSGGTPTDLATGLSGPRAVVVAGANVYFTLAPTAGTGGLSTVATTGGTVTSIQSNVTGAYGLATDGANVYWTLNAGNNGGGAYVEQIAVGGTTAKQILDFGGDVSPTSLALSGQDLYVPTDGTQAAVFWGTTNGATNLTPLDTQQSITYADVAVGAAVVYATIDDVAPAGQIVSFPLHGGVATTVATGLDHPQRLALDGANLYFTDPDEGEVWVKDTTTSDAPVVFASGLNAPLPIAVADAVYVGDADAIVKIPKL